MVPFWHTVTAKNDAHGTRDAGKEALLHGICVGEVYGLTEVVFVAPCLVHGLHMTHMAQ